MTPLYQALLFGAIGAICSWIVHRGLAAFHDGVRPLVREVAERRRPRAEAADSTWNMSLGFVLYYGAPFSLVTGVMEKHIVGLAADWIGVRSGRGTIAAAGGFAWGAAASGVISGAQWVFANLPEPIDRQLLLMGRPVYYMLPLIPVVAAASQFGIGVALRIAGLTAVTFVVAHSVDADVAVGVSFAVAAVTMLLLALRERAEVDPQID
ncbi:MAG: hypothetical protein QOF04_993, partial [Solirubrobacteraceae bacterium]|nr:hypothetical protein [Solirubrobacteraceae bacterium]